MSSDAIPNLERAPATTDSIEPAFCQHLDARGHRCRMLCASGDQLCTHHVQRLSRRKPVDEAIAADLLASIEDFSAAASVNLFLGNLTRQLVRKRIHRRDALASAYLSQLLLNSLSAMNREETQCHQEEAQTPVEIIWDIPRPRRDPVSRADQSAGTIDAAQAGT